MQSKYHVFHFFLIFFFKNRSQLAKIISWPVIFGNKRGTGSYCIFLPNHFFGLLYFFDNHLILYIFSYLRSASSSHWHASLLSSLLFSASSFSTVAPQKNSRDGVALIDPSPLKCIFISLWVCQDTNLKICKIYLRLLQCAAQGFMLIVTHPAYFCAMSCLQHFRQITTIYTMKHQKKHKL